MRSLERINKDIAQVKNELENAKWEIDNMKSMIEEEQWDLETLRVYPGNREVCEDIKETLRLMRSELSDWYDVKDDCYDRLNRLKEEKESLWLEKSCKTPNCNNLIRYFPTWEHIPNYCSECKRKFKR